MPVNCSTQAVSDTVFQQAFDPQKISEFLRTASLSIEKYISNSDRKGVNLPSPTELLKEAKKLSDSKNELSHRSLSKHLRQIIDLHLKTSISLHSTGYMARQFSSVPPVAAIYDFISSMAPQPGTFYECGPLANAADKIIAEKFGEFLKWPQNSFDMISTSGGSLANMTAVLAARNTKIENSWENGIGSIPTGRPAIAIGDDSHFSIERIAGILGLGQKAIIRLPLNENRQICPIKAKNTLEEAQRNGVNVFCIISAAGTTCMGAIDPLKDLAKLAHKFNAWLHVDAAHGGALLVSDQLRKRVQDLSLADSFCLDAHKMLFSSAPCTLLFYRNKECSSLPFPMQASYVLDNAGQEIRNFESGAKNFECTKRPSILNLWIIWCLYGREFFEGKLNCLVNLTQEAYKKISFNSHFEALNEPEINILCFRYQPKNISPKNLSTLQKEIWKKLREGNEFFISKVDIEDITALRLVIMNHEITMSDIDDLLEAIVSIAKPIFKTLHHS